MNIGIPKERRPFEFRVGLSPAGVEILTQSGHAVFVEHEAGAGAGFDDASYQQAGATLVYSTEEVFGRADLLLKVARPLEEELDWLRPGAILAGLLHLASAKQDKIDVLLEKKITSIAYEQIRGCGWLVCRCCGPSARSAAQWPPRSRRACSRTTGAARVS